jgi:putative methyltransferase (TIGR04325 family)
MPERIKWFFKFFIPPIFFEIVKKSMKNNNTIQFQKTSLQWREALKQTSGYASNDILVRCRDALLKVKNGEFPYERDSVLFTEKELFFPLLSALFFVSIKNEKKLNIIDFGGSLGSTYYQNKDELKAVGISINWYIVEQENFVKCGKVNFENQELKFYFTIDDAFDVFNDRGAGLVCLLGSVLPYVEYPYSLIDQIYRKKIEYIIIDRTMFVDIVDEDILTIQIVPECIVKAAYPAWFLSLKKFLSFIKNRYRIVFQWDAHYRMTLQGYTTMDKGYLLERLS